MDIQQELDSLLEEALALLQESIKQPDKQSERRERLCAWNKTLRVLGRAIIDGPLPRTFAPFAEQNSKLGQARRRRVLPSLDKSEQAIDRADPNFPTRESLAFNETDPESL
jgi:hypothetical protein